MPLTGGHLSRVHVRLDRLAHNLTLLRELAGNRPLWPAIKANAYGHGAVLIAAELERLGCEVLCVAHVGEAAELRAADIRTRLLVLSATLPDHAEALVTHGCEVVICSTEMANALSAAAARAGRRVAVHVKVDTGMGRIGVAPEDANALLKHCAELPGLQLRGLMSHFARADEADKTSALRQLELFQDVCAAAPSRQALLCHMANSAAIFDLPDAHFDAVRPGISIYGLKPSAEFGNPRAAELEPVLEWKTRVTFLKEVPAGTGLSYGHRYHTSGPALIATIPIGYGDGYARRLSNRAELLVGGVRCPQVGTITMDQCLVDVTGLRDRVRLGDEVVVLGRQGTEQITADELADKLETINYEIVTAIAGRVPRQVAGA